MCHSAPRKYRLEYLNKYIISILYGQKGKKKQLEETSYIQLLTQLGQ